MSYTYDNNGNTKTKSDGTQYTWDFENRLTQVVLGTGGTVNFEYDPFGRRIQKSFTQNGTTTTTDYLYDGPNLLEEVNSSGNVLARYTPSSGVDEPLTELRSGTPSYYEADGLGSITSLSNSGGTLANTYTYDSFGQLTATTGSLTNPFRYTGRELDQETGLHYYRARYYDASIGRFLQEDPLGFSGGRNFYFYVGNAATNYIDPLGLQRAIPGSETPLNNHNIRHYNCLAWGLGIDQWWIQPRAPNDSPNIVFPVFDCKKIPCDKDVKCPKNDKVAVYEDSANPNNWHVERQTCSGSWTSKNGPSSRYDDITNPDQFYNQFYPTKGKVNKTCWSCPSTPPMVMPQDPRVYIAP